MRKALWLFVLLGLASCKKNDLTVIADEKGFHPSSLELKKGGPGQVTFMRTSDKTCAKEIISKELDINKELPLNKAVTVDIPTDKDRTITFTCGMGMFESRMVIR